MQFAKHLYVLQKLSTIPRKEGTTHPFYRDSLMMRAADMNREQGLQVWDHLFEYIHENWEVPSSAAQAWWLSGDQKAELLDCRALLEMNPMELEAKLHTLPPFFTEACFPVAVARYLLRDLYIPFDHRKSTTFHAFHYRYGNMILNS